MMMETDRGIHTYDEQGRAVRCVSDSSTPSGWWLATVVFVGTRYSMEVHVYIERAVRAFPSIRHPVLHTSR